MDKFKVTIEDTSMLDAYWKNIMSAFATHSGPLDAFEKHVRLTLPQGWFVHRGGSHVAIHRTSDDDRRILIATAK